MTPPNNGDKYVTWKDWDALELRIIATIHDAMKDKIPIIQKNAEGVARNEAKHQQCMTETNQRLQRIENLLNAGKTWVNTIGLKILTGMYRIGLLWLLYKATGRADLIDQIVKTVTQ